MSKTKIEWCDMTYNPVWGCLRECEYCYARKISKRFGKKYGMKDFRPTWIESNFNKDFPKAPARIFVNSMSDVSYWTDDWRDRVINRIEQYPDLTFLFLTKDTEYYQGYCWPENCWLGYTLTSREEVNRFQWGDGYIPEHNKFFISLEPIKTSIFLQIIPDWLIVGMETGNRKNKIVPDKEWIQDLYEDSRIGKYPFFMKDNLKPIMTDGLIQELPR